MFYVFLEYFYVCIGIFFSLGYFEYNWCLFFLRIEIKLILRGVEIFILKVYIKIMFFVFKCSWNGSGSVVRLVEIFVLKGVYVVWELGFELSFLFGLVVFLFCDLVGFVFYWKWLSWGIELVLIVFLVMGLVCGGEVKVILEVEFYVFWKWFLGVEVVSWVVVGVVRVLWKLGVLD